MLSIETLDPFDDAAMAEFHAVYAAADRYGRRYATPWVLEEMTASFRTVSDYVRMPSYLVRDDGRAVAVGGLRLPLRDNVDQADAMVHVLPQRRREGIGRRLALHLAQQARAEGRTVWNAWVPGREVSDPEDTRTPGDHLCRSLGLRLGNVDVQRRLPLPVDPQHLERLSAHAAERHVGYDLVHWADRCPGEYVAAYCGLRAAMNSQAPSGDIAVEDEHWDEARLRESEAELVGSGRTRYVVAARAADGTLVGHNELVVPAHDPGIIFQWDTLVLPEHRGHRLGLALKVANQQTVQAAHRDRHEVVTFNAESNTHMIAVNEAIGFRPVAYEHEWQGVLPAT